MTTRWRYRNGCVRSFMVRQLAISDRDARSASATDALANYLLLAGAMLQPSERPVRRVTGEGKPAKRPDGHVERQLDGKEARTWQIHGFMDCTRTSLATGSTGAVS